MTVLPGRKMSKFRTRWVNEMNYFHHIKANYSAFSAKKILARHKATQSLVVIKGKDTEPIKPNYDATRVLTERK